MDVIEPSRKNVTRKNFRRRTSTIRHGQDGKTLDNVMI